MQHKTTRNQFNACFRRWTRRSYAIFNSLHLQVKIGVLALSCSLVCLKTQPVLAQSKIASSDTIENTTIELSPVEIVGQKAVPIQALIPILAIIEKQDIERAGVQNLEDLLKYVSGVDVRTRGGENVQADLSLRGGTFDQTQVLLNGVNFSDPQTGHFSLNLPINFSDIERIEVLQGSGAWTMGSAPFTAAINIITRKSDQNEAYLKASGGMYGYYQVEAGGQLRLKKWIIGAHFGRTASDGYTNNTDFGIYNAKVNLSLIDPLHVGIFDFTAGFQSKDYGANSFYSVKYKEQHENTKVFLASLQYKKQWDAFRVEAKVYFRQNYDRFDLFRHESPSWYSGPNMHRNDVAGLDAQLAYAWIGGTTVVGVNIRYEHLFSNNLGDTMSDVLNHSSLGKPVPFYKGYYYTKEADRTHFSGFLQHTWESPKWKVSFGALVDGNKDYGAHAFGGLSALWRYSPHGRMEAFVNHAYRLPTFTDLYYKSITQIGNPNLKPEQAISAEISTVYENGPWQGRAGVFYHYGFEIIDWVRLAEEEVWFSRNLTKLQTVGAEVNLYYRPNIPYLHRVGFHYTYTHVSKNESKYISLYATDYLRNAFIFSLDHAIYKSLGASWELCVNDRAGTYVNTQGKETSYKPYVLCNLKLYWSCPRFEIYVMASNLFNSKYFDLGNIPQAGIWAKAGASVRFGPQARCKPKN